MTEYTHGVTYNYVGGKLMTMTYPSGEEVDIGYDQWGRPVSVDYSNTACVDEEVTYQARPMWSLGTCRGRHSRRASHSTGSAVWPRRTGRVRAGSGRLTTWSTCMTRTAIYWLGTISRRRRSASCTTSIWARRQASGYGGAYDEFNRLRYWYRGTLSRTPGRVRDNQMLETDIRKVQDWQLDALGNWLVFADDNVRWVTNYGPDGLPSSNNTSASFSYDNGGKMLACIQARSDEEARFDAWGREVSHEVFDVTAGGRRSLVVGAYRQYDALGRVIDERQTGPHMKEIHKRLWYDAAGHVVEEDEPTGTGHDVYVWSPADGRLVLADQRGRSAPGDLVYLVDDAAGQVTAAITVRKVGDADDVKLAERYVYDPYGNPTVLAADWSQPGPSEAAMTRPTLRRPAGGHGGTSAVPARIEPVDVGRAVLVGRRGTQSLGRTVAATVQQIRAGGRPRSDGPAGDGLDVEQCGHGANPGRDGRSRLSGRASGSGHRIRRHLRPQPLPGPPDAWAGNPRRSRGRHGDFRGVWSDIQPGH